MAAGKVLVLLAALALAASVRADPPRAEALYGHPHHKTITLYVLNTTRFGNDATAVLGDTGGNIRTLSDRPGGSPVATLYQSAIYVDVTSPDKLLNFQGTFVLGEGYNFPPGKIFFVGDGTGIQAPNTLDKSIVGGTGPYVHAEGTVTRDPNGPYVITIFNW